jgi:hypothetical protein
MKRTLTAIALTATLAVSSAAHAQTEPVTEPAIEPGCTTRTCVRIALQAHWPANQVERAMLVIYGPTKRCKWGESTGRVDAVGPAGEVGLLQIHPDHQQLMENRGLNWQLVASDAETNIIAGAILFGGATGNGGWSNWTCAPKTWRPR